jgi:hypothetical protein
VSSGHDGGHPQAPGDAPPRARTALAVARGDLRDGVAGIEHFLQVLVSRRVGPRVLARSIPEVLAGLFTLLGSVDALAGAIRLELGNDPEGVEAADGLLAHAEARVREITTALEPHAAASSIDARERLAVETVVRGVAGELGTLVRLVDLFGATVTSETTTIDLGDAIAQRRDRPGDTPVLAQVDVRVADLTVGDARLVLDLLELAVATVVRAGLREPRIVVELGAEGFPVFTVCTPTGKVTEGSGGNGQTIYVVLRDELPGEAAFVRAAARHAGIELNMADDRRLVTIAL